MYSMDQDQTRAFLQEGTRTGKLATTGPAGGPHVVPVWFVLDGADLVFTTSSGSVKARHLSLQPEVSLCVDDETPPYAFVTVWGTAQLELHPADLLAWTTRIAGRYVDSGAAAAVGMRNAELDDLLVRVRIRRAVAQADITDQPRPADGDGD